MFFFSSINISYILILYFSFRYFNKYFFCFENSKCFDIFDFDINKYKNNYDLAFSLCISIICDTIFFFFYYNIFTLFTTSHLLFPFYIYEMILGIKSAKEKQLKMGEWFFLSLAFFFFFFWNIYIFRNN